MARVPAQHTLPTPYPVGPVHCYSIELGGSLVLFDTGPPTSAAREYLCRNFDLQHLAAVIISHCHIDHYGLAHWLHEEYGVPIYLPFRDSLKIERHNERLELINELLKQFGFATEYLARLRGSLDDGLVFPPRPSSYHVIEDSLPEHFGISVIPCPGHSQSDLVLAADEWAVTGDVLLRGIFQSPLLDVDLLTGERFSNYRAYCSSLAKLASLRGKTILPGHRESVESVDACVLFYVSKLFERARRIRMLSAEMSVAELVAKLFPDDPGHPFLAYLKVSEILFIRDFLEAPELLQQVLREIGLYVAVADAFERAAG